MSKIIEPITYYRRECVVFRKTSEEFGGLSNMASGFPLQVNGIPIRTSEALYQACRFPDLPDVQRLIIEQASPMAAKMVSKPHRQKTRPNWESVRVEIMEWCLRVKLAQNWRQFRELLLNTKNLSIVEVSRRDDFWGAKAVDEESYVGANVLGKLLVELREELRETESHLLKRLQPLNIPDFLLYGEPIGVVEEYETDQPFQPDLFKNPN